MQCSHNAEESTLPRIFVMNYKMDICQIIVLELSGSYFSMSATSRITWKKTTQKNEIHL